MALATYGVPVTTQREIADQLGLPIHPPKVEVFDLTDSTNTDPKSRVRTVDEYRVEPFGLYMARSMEGHATLRYVRSWLLPALDLRVSVFDWKPGCGHDQDFYLDVAEVERGQQRWHTRDLYLDISVGTGRFARVLDVDEFLLATRSELLDPATSQRAMESAYRAVDGIAAHGYDLDRWLATLGLELAWSPRREPF